MSTPTSTYSAKDVFYRAVSITLMLLWLLAFAQAARAGAAFFKAMHLPRAAIGADYRVPATAHTLKAAAEHYARMGGYSVAWQTPFNPAIEPPVFNSVGLLLVKSPDFSVALQELFNLQVTYFPFAKDTQPLVGCFDDKAKVITVTNYSTLEHPRACALAPWSLDGERGRHHS